MTVSDLLERIKSKTPLKNIESLGFSQSTIATWKSKNIFPRSDDLYKIAQYLNVSMEWLLTGKDLDLDSVYKAKYESLVNAIQNLPID